MEDFIRNETEKEANRKLVEKFPFLLPRNVWTDEVDENYDYSYTLLDDMPTGWRKRFGYNLCEELSEVLNKHDFLDKYRITQIKEKHGCLRWYDFSNFEEGYDIISKYEQMSGKICIDCGEDATVVSLGWISPYCDKCAARLTNESFISISDYYGEEREKEEES